MNSTTTTHPFEKAGLGTAPFRCVAVERNVYVACHGAPTQPGGSCDYCGTAIMWEFTIADAEGETFIVGSDCVAKTHDKGLTADVRRWKRDAIRTARHEARKATWRREAWAAMRSTLEETPGLNALLKTDHRIVQDIRARVIRFGTISEKQLALVKKIAGDVENAPAKVPVPVSDKRSTISGTVVSIQLRETDFGDQWKMLVEVTTPEGAYRLWGSVPSSLLADSRELDGHDDLGAEVLKGRAVTFAARVTRSDDDESFGFYSRPTKAGLVTAGVLVDGQVSLSLDTPKKDTGSSRFD